MNCKNPKEVSAFLKHYDPVIDGITELMKQHKVPVEDGEQIMMLVIGVSAGLRQTSINGDFVEPIAMGWALAALLGDS